MSINALEISFITREGAIKIRMMDTMAATISSVARDVGARYVVGAFDWDARQHNPVWSVYDFSRAAPNSPRGTPSLPLPIKTFTSESSDAAVMYALALLGG